MAYSSPALLKEWLGISSTTTADDALLGNLLERVTARIERYCGRRFSAVTDTRYYEPASVVGNVLWVGDDLLTVTTLTNGDSAATPIPDTEYWLVDRNEGPPYWGIRLKTDSTYAWEFDQDCWVSVLGTWGYSVDPPEDIVQACIEWAAYAYKQKDMTGDVTVVPEAGVLTVPEGMPKSVELALKSYKRIV